MLFKLVLLDMQSSTLQTTYDEVSFPYLLAYVMGKYSEEHEGYAMTPQEIAEMLTNTYTDDFKFSPLPSEITFDCLYTWELFCSIYGTIETIELFSQ